MSFGVSAPGHGVGRFNTTELNNYPHGLGSQASSDGELQIEI